MPRAQTACTARIACIRERSEVRTVGGQSSSRDSNSLGIRVTMLAWMMFHGYWLNLDVPTLGDSQVPML